MLFDCVDMIEAPFWGVLIANDGVKASLNFQPNLPQLQCHNSLWNRPFVSFRGLQVLCHHYHAMENNLSET